ncbi:hypothetical protein LCGC14_1578350 [marine sediment metagenome]|uniref:Uncharacterized protein n=1 Tax=marine sediment metagenome TaxID=412755 RepID=A0A0F9IHR7_9ZZZZ
MSVGQLVLVDWEDSHYIPEWHRGEPIKAPLYCRSVGWVVYQGTKAITLAAHMSVEEDPQRSGEMTIPTKAILKTRVLE